MDIGIGLPTTVPGVSGAVILEWARLAEERGFSSVAVLDRLVYDTLEPVVALAAAAAVTSRVRLTFSVLLAAYRGNKALLCKQLESLGRFAPGRVTLGVAAGGRADDYEVSGVDYHRRGALLDELLDELPGGLEILVGGHSLAAMRRLARVGDGWIAGGSSSQAYAVRVQQAAQSWLESNRPGRPRMVALCYFCLGPDGKRTAESYLRDYYSYFGAGVSRVLDHVVTDSSAVGQRVAAFTAAGCDELLMFPCAADPTQIELLCDAMADAGQDSAMTFPVKQATAHSVRR